MDNPAALTIIGCFGYQSIHFAIKSPVNTFVLSWRQTSSFRQLPIELSARFIGKVYGTVQWLTDIMVTCRVAPNLSPLTCGQSHILYPQKRARGHTKYIISGKQSVNSIEPRALLAVLCECPISHTKESSWPWIFFLILPETCNQTF